MGNDRQLNKLLAERQKLRDAFFSGVVPTVEHMLITFGKDQMLNVLIANLIKELEGDEE